MGALRLKRVVALGMCGIRHDGGLGHRGERAGRGSDTSAHQGDRCEHSSAGGDERLLRDLHARQLNADPSGKQYPSSPCRRAAGSRDTAAHDNRRTT